MDQLADTVLTGISGLVVEYIVAIDVTRVRFPADAIFCIAAKTYTLRICPERLQGNDLTRKSWRSLGVECRSPTAWRYFHTTEFENVKGFVLC